MSIFEPIYNSTEFAKIISRTPENLRDWRRRGLFGSVLDGKGGRYRYCKYDAIEWRMGQAIAPMFYEDDAMYRTSVAARHLSNSVLRRLGLSGEGHPYGNQHWQKFASGNLYGRFMAMDRQLNCRLDDDPAKAMKLTPLSGGWYIIDCEEVAAEISPLVHSVFPEIFESA